MEYAVETFSLTKVFSDWWGRRKVRAVDNLNLKVRTNEVFGLLGPNGSGKTTTLKLLLGLLYPTKGKAVVLGGNASSPKISAHIGFMPEESYLYKYLSARETLDFYGRLFGLPARVRKSRTEALLEMVGLKTVAQRAVGTFSKGMARRIGLAQALINDPELLILDEPTTGLDPIGTRQIKDLIIALAKRGKTVLLCSHLLADVEDICDRISIMYGGRIQCEGNVRALLEQSDRRQITTGPLSDATLQTIRKAVEAENGDFSVTSPMEKLESFFIKTVNAARKKGLVTGGVDSDHTTAISDFLTAESQEKARRQRILDELVSTESSGEPVETSPATEQVPPSQAAPAPQLDRQLLRKLTEQPDGDAAVTSAGAESNIETEPVEPQGATEKSGDTDILERLTGRNEQDPGEDKQSDSSVGDSADA